MSRFAKWRLPLSPALPRLVAIACLGLLLSACGHLTQMDADRPDAQAPTRDLRSGVDALAQPLLSRGETPGLVVGVLGADGRKQFFSYGRGELDGAALGPDSLFPIGSLSKGFLGALLTVLVDEGRFSWQETLGDLLPGTPLSPDAARITLLQLATHSSGLPRQPMDLTLLLQLGRFSLTGSNFYARFDRDFLLDYLADFSAPKPVVPGYSNIGYALIGMAVEDRMQRSLDDLLAERVLTPLGLHNTGYDPERLPAHAHRAQGHVGDQPKFMRRGQPVADWRHTGAMKGSAAIYSSARDLLDFAQAHLQARPGREHLGDLLADNLRVRYERPQDAPGVAWVTDQFDELALTNQVGMAPGHTSYVGIDRVNRRAVVVLQTSFNWNFKVGHVLLQRLARGQIEAGDSAAQH